MLKIVWLILLFQSFLFSLEINAKTTFNELLSHSEIYKDYGRDKNISTIENKNFKPNKKTILPCGYSPKYDVWIKFTLKNSSSHSIEKIIEYDNSLTTYVDFFEDKMLKKRDGMFNISKDRISLNPIFPITLKPHQSKTFYIKASSSITTLIIKLNLWNVKSFNKKNITHQIILALFLGAMGIVILYNFTIFLATEEYSYLFYALFFTTINFHHLVYKGIASLYIFSSESMITLIGCSSFIVALPTIFLALFTKSVLKLKQYPKLNKVFNYILIVYATFVIVIQITEASQYRKFFLIILIISFLIVLYSQHKKNIKASPILLGLSLFITSGIFMYLSSSGTYDIFTMFPYYTESSLMIEATLFSLALAEKIKKLNQEKIVANKNALLLKELNHRVKNSMQTMLSLLTLEKNNKEDKKTQELLKEIENRMIATAELYALLDIRDNVTVVDTHRYFSAIVSNIEKSFRPHEITINIQTHITMRSEDAIYCGLIITEAITNSFKYAFNHLDRGKIDIILSEKQGDYHLIIKDNGKGFQENSKDGLGLGIIIHTLATAQLKGSLKINKSNGVEIDIIWRKR